MKTQGAGNKRWRKAEKRNQHTAALFTRLYLKGTAGTISIHLKTMLCLLSIATLLLFQPCFPLEVGFVREFWTWMTRRAGSKCRSRIRSRARGNGDWRRFRSTSEPKRLQCNDCNCVLKYVFPRVLLVFRRLCKRCKVQRGLWEPGQLKQKSSLWAGHAFPSGTGFPSVNTTPCPKL